MSLRLKPTGSPLPFLAERKHERLGNLLVEITWKLSPRTKAHGALLAAIRALDAPATSDLARVARHLARAERILLYDANLDAAYRVLRKAARSCAPKVKSLRLSRFDLLAAALDSRSGT